MKSACLIALTLLAVCGCQGHHSDVPNSIPAVGNAIAKTDAHIGSAGNLVGMAGNDSGTTGKELLHAAGKELEQAKTSNHDAGDELTTVQKERDKLEVEGEQLDRDLRAVKAGWGYRLQTFVHRAFVFVTVTLVSLVVLHLGLGIAGLFVAGPAGTILAKLGAAVNPFAWFQTVRDNLYFARQMKNKPAGSSG